VNPASLFDQRVATLGSGSVEDGLRLLKALCKAWLQEGGPPGIFFENLADLSQYFAALLQYWGTTSREICTESALKRPDRPVQAQKGGRGWLQAARK